MINSGKVIKDLEKEGFIEFDEIKYKENYLILDLYYGFDKVEVEAAREFANENYTGEAEDDTWYDEYYFDYLYDVATDNLSEVIEEVCERYDLAGEFVMYEMDRRSNDKCEFLIVLTGEVDFDIDKVLEDIEK